MKPKDASANGKRLKYVLYAIWIVSFVLMIYGLRAPVKYRLLVEFVALTLVTSVPGYLSGRYTYRANNEKLKSRASVIIALVLLCVGLILEHEWMLIVPFAGGYLIGFAVGWSVCNRIRERYGDSPEGNELMNPVSSKPPATKERKCVAYLKSLDAESRRVVNKLSALKLIVSLGVIGIVVWMIIADLFGHLVRALFVRPGDGTLYFMATEPWTTGIPVIFLSLCVIECFNKCVLPRFAGKWKSCWLEYAQLSDADAELYYCMDKPIIRYILCTIGGIAVLGSTLVLILSVDSYVQVTDKGITINRFWGFGAETYRWSDIKEVSIKRVPYRCNKCGEMHTNVKPYILFNNGDKWKPDYYDPRLIDQCDSAFAYIEKRVKRKQ